MCLAKQLFEKLVKAEIDNYTGIAAASGIRVT
jgi:hypothetical protein